MGGGNQTLLVSSSHSALPQLVVYFRTLSQGWIYLWGKEEQEMKSRKRNYSPAPENDQLKINRMPVDENSFLIIMRMQLAVLSDLHTADGFLVPLGFPQVPLRENPWPWLLCTMQSAWSGSTFLWRVGFIHSFIHSSNKSVLSTYFVPGTLDIEMQDKVLVLQELPIQRGK